MNQFNNQGYNPQYQQDAANYYASQGTQQYTAQQSSNEGFDWDSTITEDAQDFILLPPGDYQFRVLKYDRVQFNGSEKMSACWKAELEIEILAPAVVPPGQKVTVKHNLFLHKKSEWQLSAFFAAIGQKKKGMPLRMNWQAVPGSMGRCNVGHRDYNGNKYNEIKKFISTETQQTSQTNQYTAGQF